MKYPFSIRDLLEGLAGVKFTTILLRRLTNNKKGVVMFFVLLKRLREMAKRKKMKGRSARHGRQPAPYTKYEKKPFRYSPGYYEWKRSVVAKANSRNKYAEQSQKEYRA